MKAQTISPCAYYACTVPGASRFPGAASKRRHLEKLVDALLAAVITLAVVVVGIVLLTL